MSALRRRYGCACGHARGPGGLTETQRDVLKLIAAHKHLGDYVPHYRGRPRASRGGFPVTIASRAAMQLKQLGLVTVDYASPSGFVLTTSGHDALG